MGEPDCKDIIRIPVTCSAGMFYNVLKPLAQSMKPGAGAYTQKTA